MENYSKKWRAEMLIKYMGIDNFHEKMVIFDVFIIDVPNKSVKFFISVQDDDSDDEEIDKIKKHLHTSVRKLRVFNKHLEIDKITYDDESKIIELVSKEIHLDQLPENGLTSFKINALDLDKSSNENPIQLDAFMNLRSYSPISEIEFPIIPLAMNSNTPGINTLYPIRPSRSLSTPRSRPI